MNMKDYISKGKKMILYNEDMKTIILKEMFNRLSIDYHVELVKEDKSLSVIVYQEQNDKENNLEAIFRIDKAVDDKKFTAYFNDLHAGSGCDCKLYSDWIEIDSNKDYFTICKALSIFIVEKKIKDYELYLIQITNNYLV